MKNVLVGLYPSRWRDRYGAEIELLLRDDALSVGLLVDLVHGALDAHLHPELVHGRADPRSTRTYDGRAPMSPRTASLARFLVVWLPFVGVLVATSLMLIDFEFTRVDYFQMVDGRWQIFHPYEEVYDLALHGAMAALAFAAALAYAGFARRAIRSGALFAAPAA